MIHYHNLYIYYLLTIYYMDDKEDWMPGIVTAVKSGNSFHLTLPKDIEREQKIMDRHILQIKILNTGKIKPKRRTNLVDNFKVKKTKPELEDSEAHFVKEYNKASDKTLVLAAGRSQFGEIRTKELIDNYTESETEKAESVDLNK